jgi:hypothetical protein
MIKGLQGITGITVSGGDTSLPYIPHNINNPIQGMMRINGTGIEVFNSTGWQIVATSYATVTLDQDILDVIQWARTQRQLEQNRATLIKNNPALEKAYEAIQRAEDNFDLLTKFVEHDDVNL